MDGKPVSERFATSRKNTVRQLRDKARYDKHDVYAVLDAGLIAHVSLGETPPVAVPMIYGRDGGTLYLHGARKARVVRALEATTEASVNVTLVDGIVFARSAFNSSMNYRSATVFGTPRLVEDRDKKLHGMRVISEHVMPGRWDELRDPLEKEIKMTGVIELPIETASAKISTGMPDDEDDDYEISVWAGVLPIATVTGDLVDDDRLLPGASPSDAVKALRRRRY